MSYPFAGNHYAQQSAQANPYGGTSAAYFHSEPAHDGPSYEYEPSMVARDAARRDASTVDADRSPVIEDEKYASRDELGSQPPPMLASNLGNNDPYAKESYGVPYAGNSIWRPEDKRVMAARSTPVKILRSLCCVLVHTAIVIISIVCLVVIFARPLNVGIKNVVTPTADSVAVTGTTLSINGSVDFIVSNPNSISAKLGHLTAKIYESADKSQDIGRGEITNQKIEAHQNTTVHFPYQIRYDPSKDSSKEILKDLATKCVGNQDLDLTLNIDASLTILSVPIPINFAHDISFPCPIDASVLQQIGGGDLLQVASGLGRRWLHALDDF
ncbi:hypothetical protein FA10DRAFT_267543 [Acaromyces ingoldii]|uniref:Late embryogenesis abundant protein LEA-2 subgroup domain-containing protein n=1 Tax=Acaromyces ingoldii TaxID=215250 RepID=A0A316YIC1_9BASI|nr:hypothetical protein FA10DRAFT_267543 [Acaromyces ingoldii]PWN88921.1 hypothetical protein FA10DRAFT_267543 [Acaromyces ingoldii]